MLHENWRGWGWVHGECREKGLEQYAKVYRGGTPDLLMYQGPALPLPKPCRVCNKVGHAPPVRVTA